MYFCNLVSDSSQDTLLILSNPLNRRLTCHDCASKGSVFISCSLRNSNSIHVVLISLKLSSDFRLTGSINIALRICIREVGSTGIARLK